ncbi:MAG: sterol desaturase family protein [Myxococcaceae bacterium]
MKALDEVLPAAERDRIRSEVLGRGGWYSPWLHLGVTSSVGLGVMTAAALLLQGVKWWHVGFGVLLFILSNATEWRVHRDFLHKRQKLGAVLYDRHTPEHHMIFITDDMAIRSTREFRLVLLPAFAIILIFVSLLPVMAMIWFGWPFQLLTNADQHNLAAIFALETMGYVVVYEWLHLSYHLPEESFVGRLRFVRWLKQTHAIHHDPRLMQKWNFNVSLPLWDLLRGTYVRTRERILARPVRP